MGGLRAKYLLPSCCICDSLSFDLQNDHDLKKLNLDLMTRSQGRWGGVSWGVGSVCKIFATMLLHLATPFNLVHVCTMTIF